MEESIPVAASAQAITASSRRVLVVFGDLLARELTALGASDVLRARARVEFNAPIIRRVSGGVWNRASPRASVLVVAQSMRRRTRSSTTRRTRSTGACTSIRRATSPATHGKHPNRAHAFRRAAPQGRDLRSLRQTTGVRPTSETYRPAVRSTARERSEGHGIAGSVSEGLHRRGYRTQQV